ncbi:GNAT family N-acetyltransferase [Flammeovirga pacifica]|nr:GNAT family N-acetyltransferase [Flammeovirga pacifica]
MNELFHLWNSVYPMQLAYQDLSGLADYFMPLQNKHHILVKDVQNKVVGWFFCFEREHETWFAVLVNNDLKKQHIGSTLIQLAKERFRPLNGWVIDHDRYFKLDGQKYESPLSFYLRHGFKVIENERLEIPILSAVKITCS